jgi:hypothetical protein
MAAVAEQAIKMRKKELVPETAVNDFKCMIQAVFGKSIVIHEVITRRATSH